MTRNFITVDKGYSNLKIMTYNLLAQALCKRFEFLFGINTFFFFDERKKKLIENILNTLRN